MIKERIPISGDLGSKVKQLMEYAGWYEGRSVDISIAEQYYADHGVPMMKTTQRLYRPAALSQIFRPVLRVVLGTEKAEMGS